MKIYCKEQPAGTYLIVPANLDAYNYHYEKGFIHVSELKKYFGAEDIRYPWFFTAIDDIDIPIDTLEKMCNVISTFTPLVDGYEYYFLYYYNYENACLLATKENIFEGSDYEVVEIQGKD